MWNFHRGQIFVQHGFTQASVVLYTTEEELEPLETNKQKITPESKPTVFLSTSTKGRKETNPTAFILNARRWHIYRYTAGCKKTSFAKKKN